MATKQLVPYNSAVIVTADDAATASTVAMRDSAGLLQAIGLKSTVGAQFGIASKTANFTAATTEALIYNVDSSGGAVTASLPAASASTGQVFIFILKTAGNNFILDPNSSELIQGAATKTTSTQYSWAQIWCDGSAWYALLSANWA